MFALQPHSEKTLRPYWHWDPKVLTGVREPLWEDRRLCPSSHLSDGLSGAEKPREWVAKRCTALLGVTLR